MEVIEHKNYISGSIKSACNIVTVFQIKIYISGSIKSACHILPPKCENHPCMNGGRCIDGWNRYICDCSDTGFTGPTCGKGKQNTLSQN